MRSEVKMSFPRVHITPADATVQPLELAFINKVTEARNEGGTHMFGNTKKKMRDRAGLCPVEQASQKYS